MFTNQSIAAEVNNVVREVCRQLDESVARVDTQTPEEVKKYRIAVAKIFDLISAEIFEPLYKDHPEIAPPIWRELNPPS